MKITFACGNHRHYFRQLTENPLKKLNDFQTSELKVQMCRLIFHYCTILKFHIQHTNMTASIVSQ